MKRSGAIRKNAFLLFNRGNAYVDKDDHDRALADYNESDRLDPENALNAYGSRRST